jgi:TDG/mug DNA glycosylase family protein
VPTCVGVVQGFTDVGSGHPGTASNAFTSATFEVWIAEFQARMAAHLAAAAQSIGEQQGVHSWLNCLALSCVSKC